MTTDQKKNTAIVILVAALSMCVYKIYTDIDAGKTGAFISAKGDQYYSKHADDYRHPFLGKRLPQGVWYSADTIRYYLDKIYPNLIAKMKPGRFDQSYKWGVGFYFLREEDNKGNKRFNFCVVPTLMHMPDSTVYDFFENPKLYKPWHVNAHTDDDDFTGYDAGHLWP